MLTYIINTFVWTMGCTIKSAADDATKTSHLGVPFHIRNAPTGLMKELGYGKDYKYSPEFEDGYSYQKYFPDKMNEKTYYLPSQFGFEKEIRNDWIGGTS